MVIQTENELTQHYKTNTKGVLKIVRKQRDSTPVRTLKNGRAAARKLTLT